MTVLYLIDTLAVGGSERSLLEILRRFNHAQPIICHIYPGEALKPAYEAAGIPVISLNIPGKYSFLKAVNAVADLLKKHKPDLLCTTLFRADVAGRIAGRLARVPVMSSFVNEPYHPDRWESLSASVWLKLKITQWLDRLTARWSSHFIAVSESSKAANCKALAIPPHKVSVIYRGRDPESIPVISPERLKQLRRDLSLSPESPILLNIARLLHRKGQEELVKAHALVLQAFPSARLLIAGDGHDRPKLEWVIKEQNLTHAVHLLGTRQDIPELLNLAEVFVFPSHYEGHPGSLLEAMFAARPIVASDIPVHRETITPRVSGLLAPCHHPAELSQSILWMLKNPNEAKRMGERAREVAHERFQIDHIAALHEKLHERTIQQL